MAFTLRKLGRRNDVVSRWCAMLALLFGGMTIAVPRASWAADPPTDPDAYSEVVELTNGKVYEGEIVEFVRGQHVVILLRDKRQPTIRWEHIKEIRSSRFRFRPGASGESRRDRNNDDPSTGGVRGELGVGGVGVEGELKDAERRRQAWKQRGGALATYSVQATVNGILFPTQTSQVAPFCIDQNNQLRSVTGGTGATTRNWGVGGGISLRGGLMNVRLPEQGGGTWWALRLATGVDLSASSFTTMTPSPNVYCGQTSDNQTETSTSTVVQLPVNVGFHVGLGSGKPAQWSGLVLGLAWAPGYSYYVPSKGEGAGSFSYSGFEVTVDVATLESALDSMASRAHFRAMGFFVPPVKDGYPWLLTLGFGAVWY